MNKKQAINITDEEIRGLMDFEGMVVQGGQMTFWDQIAANFKVITGSIVAVSVTALLVWVGVGDRVMPSKDSTPSEQVPSQSPVERIPVVDSVAQPRVIPEQKLAPMKVQPKKRAVVVAEKETEKKEEPAPDHTVVYNEAEPVDGFQHLYEYFGTELKYPEEAVQDSIQGLVTVTFVITRQGQIDKVMVLNSLGPAFDAEAIRLIKNMPAWKPASINGKAVPSKFSLPLTFQLERNQK